MPDPSTSRPGPVETELLDQLASREAARADAAVARILQAGPGMAPALLGLRGRTEPFMGRALYNPRAAMLLPVPLPGMELPPSEKDRVLSVEGAALYLVSALQRGGLHFSQTPLLMDPAEPQGSRTIANTPQRLARAYDAAAAWLRAYPGGAPAGSADPIAASGLRWY